MALQAASGVQVAINKQVGLGTRKTGTGGILLAIAPTGGITPQMAPIVSPTIGQDGLKTLDGLGSRKGAFSYPMVLGHLKQDGIWPSLIRVSDWTPSFTITQADITSITTTASTIVGASGNFLTLGLRRGMRIKLTGHATSANNGKWLTIISVTASVIAVLTGSLTLDATPDTSITITVAKFCYSGATPVETYWTAEEFNQGILKSELADDAKLSKFSFAGAPNSKALGTFDWISRDFDYDTTTGSALMTSLTALGGRELELSDGVIVVDGVASNIITDAPFVYDMGGEIPDVLAAVGPDVYLGNAGASGTLGALRQDMVLLAKYRAKTPFELMLVLKEPETEPSDFLSFYFGNALLQSPTKGIAQNGPMKDSIPWTAGRDEGGSDRARTVMLISSSAP